MAKRFIDTELFEDEWFMDLSKEAKLLWIYCLTKCNHAGILALNKKLCEFQTGIEDLETVKQELGNRLITLKEPYIFIPKFLYYQYPKFPNSNVKAQQSALKILEEFDLIDKGSLTLKQGLGNYYEYGYGYGNEKGDCKGENSNDQKISDWIKEKFPEVAKLPTQPTWLQMKYLKVNYGEQEVSDILLAMNNKKDLLKRYKEVYSTAYNWLKREHGKPKTEIDKDGNPIETKKNIRANANKG